MRTAADMSDMELISTLLGPNTQDGEVASIMDALFTRGIADAGLLQEVAAPYGSPAIRRLERVSVAIELGRRSILAKRADKRPVIAKPSDVLKLMEPIYKGEEREVFYILALDTRNHLKLMKSVSIGSLNAAIVHPRELFKAAVHASAASVVVTHNHPSGDPEPSGADIQLTRRLSKAGDILGIELMDHIIVGGEGRYASLRDKGLM